MEGGFSSRLRVVLIAGLSIGLCDRYLLRGTYAIQLHQVTVFGGPFMTCSFPGVGNENAFDALHSYQAAVNEQLMQSGLLTGAILLGFCGTDVADL